MDIKMDLSLIFCLGLLFLPVAKTNQTMMSLVQAMERLIDFYQNDFHNLNVDGLFGLRVFEGHLDLILQKQSSGRLNHLDLDVVTRIQTMKLRASSTADAAIQHVKKDDLEYFKQLSFVVGSPWYVFDEERRQIDPTLVWRQDIYHHAKQTVKFDETVSDNCMSELVGSHKVNGSTCDISISCIKTMTSRGLVGYGNTHQLLWTMLGEKAGCKNQMEEKLREINRGTLVSFRQEMCTNNYYQLKETLSKMGNNQVIPAFQDLFLEQLFICPSLGYYEFLHPDFLPQILSWQLPPGCFGKMKRVKNAVKLDSALKGSFTDDYKDEVDGYDDFDKLLTGAQQKHIVQEGVLVYNKTKDEDKGNPKINQESWEIPSNKGRKLLVEKEMTGGCLAHKTAVASGALVIYLRFMCEPDATEIFGKARVTRSIDHSDNGPKQVLNSAINNLNLNGNVENMKELNSAKDKIYLNQKHPALNLGVNVNEMLNKDNIETEPTKKLTFLKPNNMIQGGLPDSIVDFDGNKNVVKDSKTVNGDLDVENDMSDLNQHLKQLNDPDIHEQNVEFQDLNQDVGNQILLNDKDTALVNHGLNNHMDENNEDGELDEDIEDYDDDDLDDNDADNDDGQDDEYEDDDENDGDNGDVGNDDDVAYNDNKDNEDDDDYYDERDGDVKPFPKLGDNFGIEQPIDVNHLNENRDYDDENDDENDYDDDGYDDNDRNNVNEIGGMHPHLNLRNIGRHDYRFNDGGFNDEKNLAPDYRYKNDDDEEEEEDDDVGDDYEYDDENDEMARRREEELRGDVQFEESVKKTKNSKSGAIQKDVLRDPETISPSTAFFVFGFCITLVLILMYKFIRKRRIRIRFNPKYFSV